MRGDRLMPRIGLQLYTLRDEFARVFQGTLGAVAELGYDGVELHDLHGRAAADVRVRLDEIGLAVAGRHAGLGALESSLPQIVEEAAALGTDRVAISWIDPPESGEEARAAVDRIASVAERARGAGLRLGFHNHWGELRAFDGVSTLDLLRELPSDLL